MAFFKQTMNNFTDDDELKRKVLKYLEFTGTITNSRLTSGPQEGAIRPLLPQLPDDFLIVKMTNKVAWIYQKNTTPVRKRLNTEEEIDEAISKGTLRSTRSWHVWEKIQLAIQALDTEFPYLFWDGTVPKLDRKSYYVRPSMSTGQYVLVDKKNRVLLKGLYTLDSGLGSHVQFMIQEEIRQGGIKAQFRTHIQFRCGKNVPLATVGIRESSDVQKLIRNVDVENLTELFDDLAEQKVLDVDDEKLCQQFERRKAKELKKKTQWLESIDLSFQEYIEVCRAHAYDKRVMVAIGKVNREDDDGKDDGMDDGKVCDQQGNSEESSNVRSESSKIRCLKGKNLDMQKELEKKEEELEEIKQQHLCAICLDSPRCVVALPCNHFIGCEECSRQIKATTNQCPICRCNIQSTIKLFL